MIRTVTALSLILASALPASALAAKCNIVGTWAASVEGTSYGNFVMKTNKKGTAGQNPECNNEKATITSTTLNKTTWNSNISSKNCSTVITADATFDSGSSCKSKVGTSASGTLTIPGLGTLPFNATRTQ